MINKEMKVLLVLPFFHPHTGGSQKYAEELYTTLMNNHPEVKVDVLCYNSDRAKSFEVYRNMNVYRIPCLTLIPARFLLPEPFHLISLLIKLSKNRYNFIHTHVRFFDPVWWGYVYAKMIKAKSIFTGHVSSHPVHQNKLVELVAKIIDLTIARLSVSRYDYVTFVSQATADFFKSSLHFTKSYILLHNSVHSENFKKQENRNSRVIPKSDATLTSNNILITYAGRLIWTKGVTLLYEAAKEILKNDEFKHTHFAFAGPGELEKELEARIANDELSKKVTLTGSLDYNKVQKLLSVTDIFVNPSHHNEGLPTTILEAGASECFVIATDNGGTREAVINNETGLLIPQKDQNSLYQSIVWAIRNESERMKMASNLKTKIQKEFDWNKTSEKLYNEILKH
ncbi:hypothetical protein A2716_01670 [candidate division WWE3 bacterium RIFCSPHIGHO2_01_FULL_40_23]|uniref:Glycosyl transferase family 1 domain-containing protein n=1 Tax=candidate division WWE3 bacterium RIFCSPLOWO2_01_FULL_41_18 TaxID=1802625 RepID=A0A1F4VEM3_UNCKA|nr:MAG: hypothetical protein A2716_01670 [candidate division WWE3 bacterium RIFCSPHIGHO2_01_FULL_40_23]OGC55701.1 MAG: hypothetical protein A3A78_01520 [candidate division WWE3 bacterium RIFCSPLOWO2_01_FULL_41_18]